MIYVSWYQRNIVSRKQRKSFLCIRNSLQRSYNFLDEYIAESIQQLHVDQMLVNLL